MKNGIIFGLIALALILCFAAFMRISQLNANIESLRSSLDEQTATYSDTHHEEEEDGHEDDHYEVALVMTHFQRHANKLWFAGENENWELAHFYTHELEESMEELEEKKVVDDGINVSKMVGTMGIPPLEGLEEAIDAKDTDKFKEAYNLLVQGCNKCHTAANYPFIEITTPTTPAFSNQKYTAQ